MRIIKTALALLLSLGMMNLKSMEEAIQTKPVKRVRFDLQTTPKEEEKTTNNQIAQEPNYKRTSIKKHPLHTSSKKLKELPQALVPETISIDHSEEIFGITLFLSAFIFYS